MIRLLPPDELTPLVEQIAQTVSWRLGPDAEVPLEGIFVRIDPADIAKLGDNLNAQFKNLTKAAERLAIMLEAANTFYLKVLPSRILSGANRPQAAAIAACLLTEIHARRHSRTLRDIAAQLEITLETYRDQAPSRGETLFGYVSSGLIHLPRKQRPKPDLTRPVVQIVTGVTKVEEPLHEELLDLVHALEQAVVDAGYQPDIPGDHVHPGESDDEGCDASCTSESFLTRISALIFVNGEHGRRGMGYAASRASQYGVVVHITMGVLGEPFARVFGGHFTTWDEDYLPGAEVGDLATALELVTTFLTEHAQEINDHHAQLVDVRERLREPMARHAQRLPNEPALFEARRMTLVRAQWLLADPLHFFTIAPWETLLLADVLNVDARELTPVTYLASSEAFPNTQQSPAAPAPRPASGPNNHLTSLGWQGILAAQQLEGWSDARVHELVGIYLSPPVGRQIVHRPPCIEADDWIQLHKEHFSA